MGAGYSGRSRYQFSKSRSSATSSAVNAATVKVNIAPAKKIKTGEPPVENSPEKGMQKM